jgi:hypothetical protein
MDLRSSGGYYFGQLERLIRETPRPSGVQGPAERSSSEAVLRPPPRRPIPPRRLHRAVKRFGAI